MLQLRATGISLLFFALTGPVGAKILFHSDFERGETYLASKPKPGGGEIELVGNHRLGEWPLQGGEGIVEGNLLATSELFTYEWREGNFLKRVKGIEKQHPQWAGIRTGNLKEWVPQDMLFQERSRGRIVASTDTAMFGSYSALFDCPADSSVVLSHGLDNAMPNPLHVRLYVRFSGDALASNVSPHALLGMVGKGIGIPLLVVHREEGERIRFGFSHPPYGELTKILEDDPSNRVEPNSLYCVEIVFRRTDSVNSISALRVNGAVRMRAHARHKSHASLTNGISVGKLTHRGSGRIWIDEVVVADGRIGPKPEKCVLQSDGDAVRDLAHEEGNPVPSVQWQFNRQNAWLYPLLNTGRIGSRGFNHWQALHWIPLQDTLNRRIVIPSPTQLPTGLGAESRVVVRKRRQNSLGQWSDWSAPVAVQSLVADSIDVPEAVGFPSITKAWFARPGGDDTTGTIHRDTWYDLQVRFEPSRAVPVMRAAFVDVYLTADPENSLTGIWERGEAYSAQHSYALSFSLTNEKVFCSHTPGSGIMTPFVNREGPYFDATDGHYHQDMKKGVIRLRMRLLTEAREGPWAIRSLIYDREAGVSPVFQEAFRVVSEKPVKGPLYGRWLVLGVLAVVALAVVAVQRVRHGKQKGESGPVRTEDKVELEFDSPYDENIKKAREYILEHFREPISPRDVAEAIDVSPNWLSKFFSRGTGKGVVDYINELRVEEAKHLLVTTKLTVSEIAFKSGFNTIGNFKRAFRKLVGSSALEYRASGK